MGASVSQPTKTISPTCLQIKFICSIVNPITGSSEVNIHSGTISHTIRKYSDICSAVKGTVCSSQPCMPRLLISVRNSSIEINPSPFKSLWKMLRPHSSASRGLVEGLSEGHSVGFAEGIVEGLSDGALEGLTKDLL